MVKISKAVKGKVTSSTILEVVIAMVIIVMVLSISLMIYSNVMRLSLSSQKLKAQFILQQEMLRETGGQEHVETRTVDGYQIERTITPYPSGNLSIVHLTAYDGNHVLMAELSKIVINHEPTE